MALAMMVGLLKSVSSRTPADDDTSDRMSYRITTAMLITSAVLIASKQLVGEPITCWIPAHFTGNHEAYTNSYCWVRNTYFLPWDEHIPRPHEDDKRQMITYYQWISPILLLQALFFYLPRLFWLGLKNRVGVDVTYLMAEAGKLQSCQEYTNHEKILTNMSDHMHRMLRRPMSRGQLTASAKSVISRVCCRCVGRNRGNYLIVVFILAKILYLVNIVGQMYLLNIILGFNFSMYGIEVIQSLIKSEEWVRTPFPRVTMCDMNIRRMGNVHRYAVQCVLPINLFTEKLYLLQWFWYVMLLAMAMMEFIQWIVRIVVWRNNRHKYIKKHLELAKRNFDDDHKLDLDNIADFTDRYLRQDGVFIIRIVAKNATQGIATMFTKELWQRYKEWTDVNQNTAGPGNENPLRDDEKPANTSSNPDDKSALLGRNPPHHSSRDPSAPPDPFMPSVGFDDSTLPSKASLS